MESEGRGKRVVIIGGGVAGSLLAKSLQFGTDTVLIDPKEYFEISWASLRAMVEPQFAERTVINHRDYFINGRIVNSTAICVSETEVLTADGSLFSYDYLVIATGHRGKFPKTGSERLAQYQAENQRIKSANSILIVGGGPSGVELAGEIAVDFPEKKIEEGRSKDGAISQFECNTDESGTSQHETSAGKIIKADCHFLCTGKPLVSEWLRETILKDNLDNSERLMVDKHLRVKGDKNIFAIGDITDVPELKQGYLAQKHASVVAKNLKVVMAGGTESKLATYEPGSAIAIVLLGRKHRVAEFPLVTISGRVPGYIKSRDLFVGKTRKLMGLLRAYIVFVSLCACLLVSFVQHLFQLHSSSIQHTPDACSLNVYCCTP